MKAWFWGLSERARLAVVAGGIVLIVLIAGGIALASSGSSGGPAANAPASEAGVNEFEEAEGEAAEEATDPSIPRSLDEMIVARPHDEVAMEEQLRRQILTNEESADPTHKQEASCNYLSSYGHYVHYDCIGYSLGGQSSAIGQLEVTVDTNTGEVLVEEE